MTDSVARKWVLGGRVQGVGFRPFVYRVAQRCGTRGWVRNCAGEVEIVAQGQPDMLQRFRHALLTEAPPLARPELLSDLSVEETPATDFRIRASKAGISARTHVPPDYFTCDECLGEMNDPGDRRSRYPFINCTQCGPRYTLIERLPYDRSNTSMAGFPLCSQCAAEYADMDNRRFHAEPVGCAKCGPRLEFRISGKPVQVGADPLEATIRALRSSPSREPVAITSSVTPRIALRLPYCGRENRDPTNPSPSCFLWSRASARSVAQRSLT